MIKNLFFIKYCIYFADMDKIVFIDRNGRLTRFEKDGAEMMFLVNHGVVLLSEYLKWLLTDDEIIIRFK